MRIFSLFFLVLCIACQHGKTNQNATQGKDQDSPRKEAFSRINDAIGVIVTNDTYQLGDTIWIYDREQKPLQTIQILDEKQIFRLKCLTMDQSSYQVMLEDQHLGWIQKEQQNVTFQTWEEHIESVFAVGFNEATNPLRQDPSLNASKVPYDPEPFYQPVKVKGDWLQVKWSSKDREETAWIRWKKGEALLIELYYFA